MKKVLFYSVIFFLFSCKKEEAPVVKRKAGSAKTVMVSVSPDYKYQVYYRVNSALPNSPALISNSTKLKAAS